MATKYVTNKQFLAEIHKSKKTYCHYTDPHYADYHVICPIEEVTPEHAQKLLEKVHETMSWQTADNIIFRVMTFEHIPKTEDKMKKSRMRGADGHTRINFPPFKHYRIEPNGNVQEVGRSHWKNGLDNGEFSTDHGRMTDKLGTYFMMLVERYSRKGNWRGYSYLDDFRGNALLQLAQVGLQFDESRSSNPFAFYTTTVQNAFVRSINGETKQQNIRDDLLESAGASPSLTRQLRNEEANHETLPTSYEKPQPVKKPRGRPPKLRTGA